MNKKTPQKQAIEYHQTSSPLVLDSPHCGTNYPQDFNYSCDKTTLRQCEDTHIGTLFEGAAKLYNASFLKANFPRSYIDVNRGLNALDATRIKGDWPHPTNPKDKYTKKGRGLIWENLRDSSRIYNRQLTTAEISQRIETYYKPYHSTLKNMLDTAHKKHGKVWHINCHSMGSDAPHPNKGRNPNLADFVLGDRNGTSCNTDFTNFIAKKLQEMGYSTAINKPFAGVELVKRYSNPSQNRHSLQIEIRRDLYMNEKTRHKNQNYQKLEKDLSHLIKAIADYTLKHTNTPTKPSP